MTTDKTIHKVVLKPIRDTQSRQMTTNIHVSVQLLDPCRPCNPLHPLSHVVSHLSGTVTNGGVIALTFVHVFRCILYIGSMRYSIELKETHFKDICECHFNNQKYLHLAPTTISSVLIFRKTIFS